MDNVHCARLTDTGADEIPLTHFENGIPVLQGVLDEVNFCHNAHLVALVGQDLDALYLFDLLIRAKRWVQLWLVTCVRSAFSKNRKCDCAVCTE